MTDPAPSPTAILPGLSLLPGLRASLPPPEFRARLRSLLLDHPDLPLHQVAAALGVTRQRVSQMAGPLSRHDCAHPPSPRPAPEREKAQRGLTDLVERVRAGESAAAAAASLGISLSAASALGFRVREVRPAHGTREREAGGEWDGGRGCGCWRCRRAARAGRAGRAEQAGRDAKEPVK